MAIKSHLYCGHEYHLYCYEPIDNVPGGVCIRDAGEILPAGQIFSYQTEYGRGSYSAFSNYFRYELLWERGGWWADTDVVALCPWNLPQEHVFASERTPDGDSACASCVIKSNANSPVIGWCRDRANEKDRSRIIWGEVGPRLLGESVKMHGFSHVEPHAFCPVDWFGIGDLFELADGAMRSSLGIHLWNEVWRRDGLDKNGTYGRGCLYESLKAKFGT